MPILRSERAAGRHLMRVGRAHHQRAAIPQLGMEEADRVRGRVVRTERVRADELGEPVGLVRGRGADGPHLVEAHVDAGLRELERGLRPCEAAADDRDCCHCGTMVDRRMRFKRF